MDSLKGGQLQQTDTDCSQKKDFLSADHPIFHTAISFSNGLLIRGNLIWLIGLSMKEFIKRCIALTNLTQIVQFSPDTVNTKVETSNNILLK